LVIQDFSLVPLVCPEPAILAVHVVTDDLTAAFSATITTTLPADYLWEFGDEVTSTLPAPTHTYVAYGTYPYTLTVTNDCGADDWSAQVTLLAPRRRTYLPLIFKNWP
jgi:hypothetical protein